MTRRHMRAGSTVLASTAGEISRVTTAKRVDVHGTRAGRRRSRPIRSATETTTDIEVAPSAFPAPHPRGRA
jgi:hypothetical protein